MTPMLNYNFTSYIITNEPLQLASLLDQRNFMKLNLQTRVQIPFILYVEKNEKDYDVDPGSLEVRMPK